MHLLKKRHQVARKDVLWGEGGVRFCFLKECLETLKRGVVCPVVTMFIRAPNRLQ